jgi:putative phosphoesterase
LAEVFAGVDLILHGGDIYDLSVLNDLERIAPVFAARGDDDYGETARDERVKEKHVLKVGENVIWLIHQRPYVSRYSSLPWWESQSNPEIGQFGKPNIVVFGHEHRTALETIGGTLFVSPGSPTFLHYQQGLGTYGIIETNSGSPDVQVLKL